MKNTIKLVVTDMDGTFLNRKGQFDKTRLKNLLVNYKAKGIQFAVASGRGMLSLEKKLADVKDELLIIAENGTLVTAGDKVLYEAQMPPSLYLDVIQKLVQGPYGEFESLLLSGRHGAYVHQTASEAYISHMKHYYENVQVVDRFDAVDDEILKVTAKFSGETVLAAEAWITQQIPGVIAMTTGFDSVDIVLEGVDKRVGLEHICQQLNLTANEVMAFGDNLNDFQMMQFAGTAIAPANARDEVKAIATEVIGDCDEEAVIAYMEELVK